jgi:hypothetical protein
MASLRIGVKFCGGCNPVYERRAAYEDIMRGVTERAERTGAGVDFERAEVGVMYDALLVIGGCASRCADVSGLRSRTPAVHVWNGEGIPSAADLLAERALAAGSERGADGR